MTQPGTCWMSEGILGAGLVFLDRCRQVSIKDVTCSLGYSARITCPSRKCLGILPCLRRLRRLGGRGLAARPGLFAWCRSGRVVDREDVVIAGGRFKGRVCDRPCEGWAWVCFQGACVLTMGAARFPQCEGSGGYMTPVHLSTKEPSPVSLLPGPVKSVEGGWLRCQSRTVASDP